MGCLLSRRLVQPTLITQTDSEAETVDFPPIDDPRWDRLLGVVLAQRPTTADSPSPLATIFPSLAPPDEPEQQECDTDTVTDLEPYARPDGETELPSGRRSSASS